MLAVSGRLLSKENSSSSNSLLNATRLPKPSVKQLNLKKCTDNIKSINMTVVSKSKSLLSPITLSCCEYFHPYTASCTMSAAGQTIHAFQYILRTYSAVYLVRKFIIIMKMLLFTFLLKYKSGYN